MRKRLRLKLPLTAYPFIAVLIVALSLYISCTAAIPVKMVYIGSLLAMPEGLGAKITQMKDEITEKYFSSDGERLIQKGSSINDLIKLRSFTDLTVTPDDITESVNNAIKQFEKNGYEYDGETVERNFTSYQATDSFDGVYLRNVTADSDADIEKMLSDGCKLPISDFSKPTVLIYHTHSTESYALTDNGKFSSAYPTRNDDNSLNMIRVGEEIAAVLEAKGIGVIHDKTVYDTVYTGAYGKSRTGIEEILEKNPSVIITLDIHRDAVYYDDYTRVKPTAEISGVKVAQMMIIAGARGGNVTDFPDWETNLSFALNLQKAVNSKYEGLMKPIYFCNRKYNMDITPYSLLIEVGTDVNTLEEAAYSGRLLGDALASYIKENCGGSE